MKRQKTGDLTASLHTVTSAANVARYVLAQEGRRVPIVDPAALAGAALRVLGYPGPFRGADPTYARIVAQCEALIGGASS